MEREATRSRSPGYPNFGLPEALARVRKIFEADRRNPIDRTVAMKHMGYGGPSGAADKAMATLMHFNLLERAGKGEVRVSQLALDILHPDSTTQQKDAVKQAAFAPTIFQTLKERFPDDRFSDDALRSYLVRIGFLNRAIEPVVRSYCETCLYLEQMGAYESDGGSKLDNGDLSDGSVSGDSPSPTLLGTPPSPPLLTPPSPPIQSQGSQGISPMAEERVLISGPLSKDSGFRLIVNGRIGVKEIERLIRKLELEKEILADSEDDQKEGSIFS